MLVIVFFSTVIIFSVRTFFLGYSLFKNKKRGAFPLFVLSVICLISPILSVLINRLI